MRATFVFVNLFLVLMLTSITSFATDSFSSDLKIFKNRSDALQFCASSTDEFYLLAGSYKSVKNSLKRQFHLSREINYPVMVEVRGKQHLVLVGPLRSAKAVKELSGMVFASSTKAEYVPVYPRTVAHTVAKVKPDKVIFQKKTRHKPSVTKRAVKKRPSTHDVDAIFINTRAKALHLTAPSVGKFYLQAGAFNSAKNAGNYQRALSRKISYPVINERRGNHHVVLVGPVHTLAEVRTLGSVVFASDSGGSSGAPGPDAIIIKTGAKASNFNEQSSKGPFYLQAGAYGAVQNARNHQRELARRVHYPVMVETQGGLHVVLVGPVRSAADVRLLGGIVFGSTYVTEPVVEPVVRSAYEQPPPQRFIPDKDVTLMPAKVQLDHFDLFGAGGVASSSAGESTLDVTVTETDRLVQTNRNSWNIPTGQLGMGYVHAFPGTQQYTEHVQWFPFIEPEFNVYYLGGKSVHGDVNAPVDSDINSLTYDMPFHSTRLMFDAALTVITFKQYAFFGKAGFGDAWNSISYNDQRMSLNSKTSAQFAWEAGGGLAYAFNDRAGISLEYLYTNLGSVSIEDPVITLNKFNLSVQSVLLGLHIAL